MSTSVNLNDGLSQNEIRYLAELSEEDRKQVLEEALQNLDDAKKDLKKTKSENNKEIREARSTFKEQLSDLKKASRQKDLTTAEKREMEGLIRELTAMIDSLDSIGDELETAYDDYAKFNVDASSGKDVTISDVDEDGKTYTYKFGSGASDPFTQTDSGLSPDTPLGASVRNPSATNQLQNGSNRGIPGAGRISDPVQTQTPAATTPTILANLTSEEKKLLKDANLIDDKGQVKIDYNEDGVKNYNDIQKFLDAKKANGAELGDEQVVEIRAGSNWDLQSYDPRTGTWTWKVGNSTVIWENAANVKVVFHTGINLNEIKQIDSQRPELLKNMFWQSDTASMAERLHGDEETGGAELEERLKAIPGYQKMASSQHMSQAYDKAVEKLFAYLDGYSTDSNVREVWNEIFAGLSKQEKERLVHDLLQNGFKSLDIDNFQKLFKDMSRDLENIIFGNPRRTDLAPAEITSLMILVQHSGGQTSFGTPEDFLTKFFGIKKSDTQYTPGKSANHANNMVAFEYYNELVQTGKIPPMDISVSYDAEYALANLRTQDGTPITVSLPVEAPVTHPLNATPKNWSDLFAKMDSKTAYYADTWGSEIADGVTEEELNTHLVGLINKLEAAVLQANTEGRQPTVEELQKIILDTLETTNPIQRDHFACAFIDMLTHSSSSLADALFKGPHNQGFRDQMWKHATEDGELVETPATSDALENMIRRWVGQPEID